MAIEKDLVDQLLAGRDPPNRFQRLPRCQRSHNSVFSAAVNPRRNLCVITTHSISYRSYRSYRLR